MSKLTNQIHVNHTVWVHALGVSVEIELVMDWQVCKQGYYFQFLHLNGRWDQHEINTLLQSVNIVFIPLTNYVQYLKKLKKCTLLPVHFQLNLNNNTERMNSLNVDIFKLSSI